MKRGIHESILILKNEFFYCRVWVVNMQTFALFCEIQKISFKFDLIAQKIVKFPRKGSCEKYVTLEGSRIRISRFYLRKNRRSSLTKTARGQKTTIFSYAIFEWSPRLKSQHHWPLIPKKSFPIKILIHHVWKNRLYHLIHELCCKIQKFRFLFKSNLIKQNPPNSKKKCCITIWNKSLHILPDLSFP